MGENFSYSNRFKFVIEDDSYTDSKFELLIDGFTIPGMSLGTIEQHTPIRSIFKPGNEITFDELVITFKIDENWESWLEIFNWFKSITSTTEINDNEIFKNASIILLDTKYNPLKSLNFIDIFPTNLAPVDKGVDMESLAVDSTSITFKINDMEVGSTL